MPKLNPIMRYPGSKAKLAHRFGEFFPHKMSLPLWHKDGTSYIEPFVGSGAMTAYVLRNLPCNSRVWLNDKDMWLVCLWQTIIQDPGYLCKRIREFVPSAEAFYEFKTQDGEMIDPGEAGFRKLALHQTSFSGLGVMAGGPLGGRSQNNSQYTPACRWRPERLRQNIMAWNRQLSRFRNVNITCKSFAEVVQNASSQAFVYLDPPYYEKGLQLYKHSMQDDDHVRLSVLLKASSCTWVLSYDDHPRIRELYNWATIRQETITYTTATSRDSRRPKNHEIVIVP
jgi:DNA adenine methylase